MKLIRLITTVAIVLTGLAANAAPSQWEQPAANLATQIAEILGPSQARLTIRNLSTIPNDEIPAIRRLLEQDLKTHGVLSSGAESANQVRVTLSENQRERLWVAAVVEGNETRVAMVQVGMNTVRQQQAWSGVTLRKQNVFIASEEVLSAVETAGSLIAVEPEQIVIYTHAAGGWREQKRVGIGQRKPLARDPRGLILSSPSGDSFEASIAGWSCSGSYQPAQTLGEWTISCRESDDPWTISQGLAPQQAVQEKTAGAPTENGTIVPIKAFYNSARNYFTGVLTPSLSVDLAPFYSASIVPRPVSGAALLIGGIDGKVQLAENGALKPVSGARDWGSDFATLNSGCGTGTQIVAAGSGEAISDSLRAYELPALEAVPASAPLAMDGTVTALWTAPDGKSIFAVMRKTPSPGTTDQYEVDRVTASCN